MAAGGWGAGALYDHFGYYLPAFAAGIGFNIVNLVILLTLVFRQRDKACVRRWLDGAGDLAGATALPRLAASV